MKDSDQIIENNKMETKVVLVIDDEQSYINTISRILSARNFKIIQAVNGKMGVMVAQRFVPDIIITDWEMPEMDGIEATRHLKQNPLTKDIPIIIATGVMIKPDDLSLALSAGAVDFLRKPLEETELLARTESALRLANAYKTIKEQNEELKNQLTSKLIQIQQHNELKLSIKENLDKITALTANIDFVKINKQISHTSNLLTSKAYDVNWADFESHFELVNKGYLQRLKSTFKDLTDYDLRLCAFLKLKMNSKEIANIIYTSPDSVITARKRLKKKLNLSPDQSLQDFISDF